MSKHKQPGGIWTAQYAHCALEPVWRLESVDSQMVEVVNFQPFSGGISPVRYIDIEYRLSIYRHF